MFRAGSRTAQGRVQSGAVVLVPTLSIWRTDSQAGVRAVLLGLSPHYRGPERFHRAPLSWLRSSPSSTGWEKRPKEDRFPLEVTQSFRKLWWRLRVLPCRCAMVTHTAYRGQFCPFHHEGSGGSSSGHQACGQAPLPVESHCQTSVPPKLALNL